MAEKDNENAALPLPVLILVTALMSGLIFVPSPLNSSRPAGLTGASACTVGNQVVESRLWEDPLSGLVRARDKKAEPTQAADETLRRLAQEFWGNAGKTAGAETNVL